MFSRRSFIKSGSSALALASVYNPRNETAPLLDTSRSNLKELAGSAIGAAKSAGAIYADVVFINTRTEHWMLWGGVNYPTPSENFIVSTGVRALYNGYWGFAGTDGAPTKDIVARLGNTAALQARNSSRGRSRNVQMVPVPPISDGNWVMPVEIDPISLSRDEKIDFMTSISDLFGRERIGIDSTSAILTVTREERAFASTEGSFTTQTVYTSQANVAAIMEKHFRNEADNGHKSDFATPAGAGWEYIRNAPWYDNVSRIVEHAARGRFGKPVDVGKYEVVFDAYAMAQILDETIGQATELDRALGYEANEIGTSFLSEPVDMLGTFRVGSPLVNISANRSMKGGAATVRWDDEGVEPLEVKLVTNGILTGFQTMRGSASWLSPYYEKVRKVVTSSGSAGHSKANRVTTHCAPNFIMEPGGDGATFDDLVAGTKRGIAVIGAYTSTDHQALNGSCRPLIAYEIRNGKMTDVVLNASFLYRAPEFWKNVVALGGANSARNFGIERSRDMKYERYYVQKPAHTVSSVPAKVTGVTIVDMRRKA